MATPATSSLFLVLFVLLHVVTDVTSVAMGEECIQRIFKDALRNHNQRRALHGSPPLLLNREVPACTYVVYELNEEIRTTGW